MSLTGQACPVRGNTRGATARIPQVGVSSRLEVSNVIHFLLSAGKGSFLRETRQREKKLGKKQKLLTYNYQYKGPALVCLWFIWAVGNKNKLHVVETIIQFEESIQLDVACCSGVDND